MPVSKRRKPKSAVKRRPMDPMRMRAACLLPLENNTTIADAHDYCLDGWVAYDAMTKNPQEKDFITLLQICNEVVCLWNMGFAPKNVDPDEIIQAQEGLLKTLERSRRLGSWALDGTVLQAIRGVIYAWENQYRVAPIKAIKAVKIALKEMEKENPDHKTEKIYKIQKKMVRTRKGVMLI